MPASISHPPVQPPAAGRRSPAFWRAALAALVLLALFLGLGSRGLDEPDEGRFSEIGREMAESGDYLVPRIFGTEHLSKPPVTYWLVALSLKLFGVNEFAARLPAALAAAGTLAAVYLLARSAFGESAALLSVLVLLSSLEFFIVSRLITTDMILTCMIAWSVWSFWRWYASPGRSWGKIFWFYFFLSAVMMTKGPLLLSIPLLAVAGIRWRNPGFRLRQMHWGKGALVFFLLSAPWFVMVAGNNPDLWRYFLLREVVERVATQIHHRLAPFWYFVPVMAAGFLPWTALLPASVSLLRRQPGRGGEMIRACLFWAAGGLFFFSLSQSKLPTYVLPLYAPLAILVGAAIVKVARSDPDSKSPTEKKGLWLGSCYTACALFLAGVIGMAVTLHSRFAIGPRELEVALVIAAAGAALTLGAIWRKQMIESAGILGCTAVLFWVSVLHIYPSLERRLGITTSAKFFAERINAEDPDHDAPVLIYRAVMCGMPFYLERPILRYQPRDERPAMDGQHIYEFTQIHPGDPMVIPDFRGVRRLLSNRQKVFCVAYESELNTLSGMSGISMHELDRVGRWVLLCNRPSIQNASPSR